MIKFFISLLLIISNTTASDYLLSSKYKISYGYFGTIGKATADLVVEKGTYKIKVKAQTTGLVKVLTRSRIEVYESTGIVKNGLFIPDVFIESKKRGDKIDTKRYIFDHKKNIIYLFSSKDREDSEESERKLLPYYTENDLLSLFFNLKHYLNKNQKVAKNVSLIAVGANRKSGKIDVTSIDKENKEILEFFKDPNNLFSVVLNQRIFASKKGEMFIDLNDEGICTSAVLKDVIMFGDIRGTLLSMKKEKLD